MQEEPTSRLTAARRTAAPERRLAVLKILAGPHPGKLVRIERGSLSIGRGPKNDLVLKDAQVSRQHARIDSNGDGRVVLTDLGSTNGTTIEGQSISTSLLKDGDQIALGDSVVLRFSYLDVLEEKMERAIFDRANPEPLSLGRPEFMQQLQQELQTASARGYTVTVALLGLDHFKQLNESKGHPAGDAVLRELVARIRAVLRSRDLVGRYSGEEFALMFPELSLDSVRAQLERIRLAVSRRPFTVPDPVTVTVSGGATQSGRNANDAEVLLGAASRALAQARSRGHNQVVSGTADEFPVEAGSAPAQRGKQRRSATRVGCSIAVACRAGDMRFSARVLDIGITGLRLTVPERLGVGAQLHVVPEAGGMEPITVEVLWCRKRRNQEVLEIGVTYPDAQDKVIASWVGVAMKRLGFGLIPITERRRSVRVACDHGINLTQGMLRFPARMVNLCAEGATVESGEPLTPGSLVKIGGLAKGTEIGGTVIYCRACPPGDRHRSGIRFDGPLSEELVNILAPE